MPLYAMIGRDKPQSLALRQAVRPKHLAHLESLGEKLVLAGPFQNEAGESTGSFVVVEAADLDAAKALIDRDPYVKEGLFASYELSRFGITINESAGR